jgi:type II secretory pathway pseudopilin PulG
VTFAEACALVVAGGGAGAVLWRVVMGVRAARAAVKEEGRLQALREASEARAKDESRARLERLEVIGNQTLTETQHQSKDLAIVKHQLADLTGARQDHEQRLRRMETKS